MDDMKIFEHPDFGRIRTVELDGQGWLVGKDVAEVLGYEKPTDAIRKHVPEEDRGISKMETPSGSQNMTIINESGLYSLIFSSKLPSAKAFKFWVTSEVLPSIRKHGAYLTPETIQNAILNPDTLIQLATALKDEQNKNRALQADNSKLLVGLEIARPKAEYFDELVNRSGLTSFRETAKELGVQPKKFVEYLLSKKFIYRDQKGKLLPYEAKNNGYFEVKESFNEKTSWSGTQTLVTPKGREMLLGLHLENTL